MKVTFMRAIFALFFGLVALAGLLVNENGPTIAQTAVGPVLCVQQSASQVVITIAPCPSPGPTATPTSTPTPGSTPTPSFPFLQQQAKITLSGTTTTSLSASLIGVPNTSSGVNYLLAWIGTGSSQTVVHGPVGWSQAVDAMGTTCYALNGSGQQGAFLWIKQVQSGDTAGPYTFTFSAGDFYGIAMQEVDNVSSATPIEQCAGNKNNGSTGAATGATLTATISKDLPIAFYAPSTTGLTVAPGSGWHSANASNPATQYLTMDVEDHANLSSAGTITPSTTFGNVGTSIVYLPSVGTLWVPSGQTAPTPTPSPTGTPVSFSNGVEWSTSFTPYGPTSPWNQRIADGTTPQFLSNSAAIIAIQFNSTGLQHILIRNSEAGNNDAGHPVYFASATDPLVTINCRTYCDTADNGGFTNNVTQIRIPVAARPAAPGCTGQTNCAGDHHFSVIQADGSGVVGNGDEWDFYGVTTPTGNWGTAGNTTISAGAVQRCGNFKTSSGINPNGSVTVGGACVAAGLVRANELIAGRINHALFLLVNCAAPASQNVYPVQNGAGTDVCTNYSSGDAAPPLGGRLWLDYSDAYIAGLSLSAWNKALLYALHDYGGFIEDDVAGGSDVQGLYIKQEAGEMFSDYGTDPFSGLVASPNNWTDNGIPTGSTMHRYTGADPWAPAGINFAGHLHYLAPCVTQQTC